MEESERTMHIYQEEPSLTVIIRILCHTLNHQDYLTLPEEAEGRKSDIHYKRISFA